jgi:hypothetical protein
MHKHAQEGRDGDGDHKCHCMWTQIGTASASTGKAPIHLDFIISFSKPMFILQDPMIEMSRVRHGYGKTRGVPKTGSAGTGTVPEFHTHIDIAPITTVHNQLVTVYK